MSDKRFYKRSFSFYREFESRFETELFKLIAKVRKANFDLRYSTKDTYDKNGKSMVEVDIYFEAPVIRYKDYEYLATLYQDNNKGNLVFSDSTEDFSKYFKGKFRCDHCHTNRRRYTAHLFRNSKGKDLMIATACSKEYFGANVDTMIKTLIRSVNKLANMGKKYNKLARTLVQFDTESFCRFLYGYFAFNKHYVSFGYLTKKNTVLYKDTQTFYAIRSFDTYNYWLKNRPEYAGRSVDESAIKAFNMKDLVAFWDSKMKAAPSDKDINNLYVGLRMVRPFPYLLVQAVWKYMQEAKPELLKKPEPKPLPPITTAYDCNNKYFGTVGSKVITKAKVTKVAERFGPYGRFFVYTMVDTNGYRFTMFSNRTLAGLGAVEGAVVKLSGEVKKYNEYNGQKSTQLERYFVEKATVVVPVARAKGSYRPKRRRFFRRYR